MAKFSGHLFCTVCSHLTSVAADWSRKKDAVMSPAERHQTLEELSAIAEYCEEAGLINAAAYIRDALNVFKGHKPLENVSYGYFIEAFGNLQPMIKSEMKRVEYLRV